jgi:hypothetical protein
MAQALFLIKVLYKTPDFWDGSFFKLFGGSNSGCSLTCVSDSGYVTKVVHDGGDGMRLIRLDVCTWCSIPMFPLT